MTHCPAMRVSHQGGVPRQPPLPLPQRLFEKIFPTLPPQPGPWWWEPWGPGDSGCPPESDHSFCHARDKRGAWRGGLDP